MSNYVQGNLWHLLWNILRPTKKASRTHYHEQPSPEFITPKVHQQWLRTCKAVTDSAITSAWFLPKILGRLMCFI